MELGALICIPEQPRCAECPLARSCRSRSQGIANELPELRSRPKPLERHVVVLIAERDDRLLLVRQPAAAQHWSNLFTLPYAEQQPGELALVAAKRLLGRLDPRGRLQDTDAFASFTYPITRFRFKATAFRATGIRTTRLTSFGGRYATGNEVKEIALPAPHRRLFARWAMG
jgi:adenine-specific DNA glycosylase